MISAGAPLQVAVVEDNALYRHGLEGLLALSPGFELAGSFPDAVVALEFAEKQVGLSWDLVLMDLGLPGLSGVEATRRIKKKWPNLPVVVLTVFEEPNTILAAITAGADGYLLKRTPPADLLAHLRMISAGGSPLTGGVARTILSLLRAHIRAPSAGASLDLTDREHQVLSALVEGQSYKQVADTLGISLDTVRTHIRNVYRKLQVHSVAEAVSRALRERLV